MENNLKLNKKAKGTSSEVLFSSDTEKITMGISTSGAVNVIERLTDLYSNPAQATIRELVSNAIDASLVAGTDKSIEVNLNGTVLSVKDYGTGMTKEELLDVYSQYGNSTKGTDFSQTGAFGLGAKAPLSLVEAFFVKSIKDGKGTLVKLQKTSSGFFVSVEEEFTSDEVNSTIVEVEIPRPVDAVSIEKAMKGYAGTPTDVPLSLKINGEEVKASRPLSHVMDFDVKVGGEVLTLKGYIEKESDSLRALLMNSYKLPIRFIVGGWIYSGSQWGSAIYVEIPSALVDFNSSRDSIIANSRHNALSEELVKQISAIKEDLTIIQKSIDKGYLTSGEVFASVIAGGLPSKDVLSPYLNLRTEKGVLLSEEIEAAPLIENPFVINASVLLTSDNGGDCKRKLNELRTTKIHLLKNDGSEIPTLPRVKKTEAREILKNSETKFRLPYMGRVKMLGTPLPIIVSDCKDKKDVIRLLGKSNAIFVKKGLETIEVGVNNIDGQVVVIPVSQDREYAERVFASYLTKEMGVNPDFVTVESLPDLLNSLKGVSPTPVATTPRRKVESQKRPINCFRYSITDSLSPSRGIQRMKVYPGEEKRINENYDGVIFMQESYSTLKNYYHVASLFTVPIYEFLLNAIFEKKEGSTLNLLIIPMPEVIVPNISMIEEIKIPTVCSWGKSQPTSQIKASQKANELANANQVKKFDGNLRKIVDLSPLGVLLYKNPTVGSLVDIDRDKIKDLIELGPMLSSSSVDELIRYYLLTIKDNQDESQSVYQDASDLLSSSLSVSFDSLYSEFLTEENKANFIKAIGEKINNLLLNYN